MRGGFDAVVLGSGVVGLALSLELARRGLKVAVTGPPGGAGRWSDGVGLVNTQTRSEKGAEGLQDLLLLARQLYPDWIETVEAESGLSAEFDLRGGLAVALTDPEEVVLDRALDWQRSRSLPIDVLTEEHLASREPSLSAEIRTAFSFSLDGMLDAGRLHRALLLTARTTGIRFLGNAAEPSAISEGGRAITIDVEGAKIATAMIIETRERADIPLGAGVHLSGALSLQPIVEIDASTDPNRLSRFVMGQGTFLVPRRDGTMVLLGTSEEGEAEGFPKAGGISRTIAAAARILPDLLNFPLVSVAQTQSRLSSDGNPVIGETAFPGHFVATALGFDRIALAPALVMFLADLLTGRTPPIAPDSFRPERFAP